MTTPELLFWIAAAAVAAFAAVSLLRPFARPPEGHGRGDAALAIYRNQLAEIDRQVAAGELEAADADASRREIKRRILASAPEEGAPAPTTRATRIAVAGGAVFAAMGAFALYLSQGAPGAADMPLAARDDSALRNARAVAEMERLVVEVEARVLAAETPDRRGIELLAVSYAQLGRAEDAARAFGALAALEPQDARWPSAQGAALVQAANGQVSPAASAAFAAALARDPTDVRARYFTALGALQNDAPERAIDIAIGLADDIPENSPLRPTLGSIVDAARAALADPAAQSDRINAMVDGLAERLADGGGTFDEWMRLGRAELVRGRPEAAAAAYAEALRITPNDAAAQAGAAEAAAAVERIQQ